MTSQLLVWRTDVVLTVVLAMVEATVLAVPIAHVYRLTKHRHEYDPAVTETILILPAVVAAIVIVVQGSLALSFSLVGVAAAVRFRSNLKDTNDAMFIFFAIALGIAAAVKGLDMALAMCVVFYSTVFLVSKRRNVGSHAVAAEDGAHTLSSRPDESPVAREGDITVRAAHVKDAETARVAVEARLGEESKRWKLAEIVPGEDGETLEYHVRLKKKTDPHTLLDSLKAAAQPYGATVEYREYRGSPRNEDG